MQTEVSNHSEACTSWKSIATPQKELGESPGRSEAETGNSEETSSRSCRQRCWRLDNGNGDDFNIRRPCWETSIDASWNWSIHHQGDTVPKQHHRQRCCWHERRFNTTFFRPDNTQQRYSYRCWLELEQCRSQDSSKDGLEIKRWCICMFYWNFRNDDDDVV